MSESKAELHRYLRAAREAMLWKLDGLSEYQLRRPLTPTGTNLLGLVKHLSTVELLYFGFVFDRHFPEPVAWFGEHVEPLVDMSATEDESREYIVGVYEKACQHADATIEELELDTVGFVPWWPGEECKPSLHRVLVHVLAEVQRHLGHADIVRELIDGSVGQRDHAGNVDLGIYNDVRDVAPGDQEWWKGYLRTLEHRARQAG